MKLKHVFVCALASITLFSCSKDNEGSTPDPTLPVEEGTSQVILNVVPEGSSNPSTYATVTHPGNTPTADEGRIFNYAVLIFNSQQQLEKFLPMTEYAPSTGDPAKEYSAGMTLPVTDDQGNTVISLTAGYKYFFVLANASAELLARQQELMDAGNLTLYGLDNLLEVTDMEQITSTLQDPNSESDPEKKKQRGFLMTSKNVVGINLPRIEENSTPEQITLSLGRAMAKVSLGSALDAGNRTQQPNGDLAVSGYKIKNNPKKCLSFLILRTAY